MHDRETVAEVLRLVRQAGLNHCEVSRRTGVPRPTVRDWANGKLPHSFQRKPVLYGRPTGPDACRKCGAEGHDFERLPAAYVYCWASTSATARSQDTAEACTSSGSSSTSATRTSWPSARRR